MGTSIPIARKNGSWLIWGQQSVLRHLLAAQCKILSPAPASLCVFVQIIVELVTIWPKTFTIPWSTGIDWQRWQIYQQVVQKEHAKLETPSFELVTICSFCVNWFKKQKIYFFSPAASLLTVSTTTWSSTTWGWPSRSFRFLRKWSREYFQFCPPFSGLETWHLR